MSRRLQARIARAVAVVLVALAIGVAAGGLERRTTWYLASDQFAFLTIASDLARGHVLHPTEELELIAPVPWGSKPRDALFQTYYWSGRRLYSRYPPGFPAILAAAGWIGGETAQHAVNPVLFLVLLGVVAWACWAALRSHDRSLAAGAAVAAVWLLLLLPTQVHLWGITVVRDLPAHLLALCAIVAALYAAFGVAGLLLGFAASVRPDAVLYGVSLATLLAVQRAGASAYVRAAVGFAIGAVPLLLYNYAARGNLFAFTQAGEFDRFLSSAGSPWIVLAELTGMPSGGGFRVAHFATTLPGLVRMLIASFSWSGLLVAVALAWSVRSRAVVAAAFVPYVAIAVPFYGFWSHPDARYLAGVDVALVVLAATGAAVLCRYVADPRTGLGVRLAVAAAALAVAFAAASGVGVERGWLAATDVGLALAVVAAALTSFAVRAPGGLRAVVLAPGVALALVGTWRMWTAEHTRDPFQRDQVERAREVVETLVPVDGIVLVGEGLGRPAENIAHYTHANAYYVSELRLLQTDVVEAAARGALVDRRTFLLLSNGDPVGERSVRNRGQLKLVESRDGASLYDWFVDPRSARAGAAIYEVQPSDSALAAVRERVRLPEPDPAAGRR
ncbi:MAG TPA: hypothetical protein VFB01_18955 [Burkholderiales bacterium]|nr:hypothetical protein [Burkholderiales bacterium]